MQPCQYNNKRLKHSINICTIELQHQQQCLIIERTVITITVTVTIYNYNYNYNYSYNYNCSYNYSYNYNYNWSLFVFCYFLNFGLF